MYKIVVLELKQVVANEDFIVHPIVIVDSSQLILVDCGFIGSIEQLKKEFIKNDLEIKYLKKIIVTHHDHDHIANLSELKKENPNLKIYASKEEKEYIEGSIEPFRLTQAKKMQAFLSGEKAEWGLNFMEMLKSVELANVDEIVADKTIVPCNTKVEIVETYGHTKGHISVYLEEAKTLITGDALVVIDNELKLANPELSYDLEKAKQSLIKLLDYDIEKVICYHGGIFENDFVNAINKLL
ncbi:glyoxylase-like metal-dependent hydrolase (beta-lactamase superfamily II) [Bacilli bacterium PM5-3]|nr:glyoxylase-like metal-dependent hydrolase (beta-lactamase superfamily II) [Bacilli bacterium PM5-3]MDH6603875.1 glyoxylase-like metal-dependent hydrolase (beta-lactamase superfamily II) [Bacilli bacterium PM5-9]